MPDNGVDHLLRQLAHCRGHHGLLPLEIPAEHAHDGQDQKRRCQDPQGKGALRCVQHLVCEKSRTKKGDHRGGDTGHQGKYHGAVEHSLGIAVFPSGISRRHLLGHGQWNAVGGHQQHDGVNVKGTGIEALPSLPMIRVTGIRYSMPMTRTKMEATARMLPCFK